MRIVKSLREHGRVIRADFGIQVRPVSDALRAQMPKLPKGASTVTLYDTEGPAAKAGIRTNDILLSVNGKEPVDAAELREALVACKPGEPARCKVLRAGKVLELSVKPTEKK